MFSGIFLYILLKNRIVSYLKEKFNYDDHSSISYTGRTKYT